MSAATQFDLARAEILDRYILRINNGDRTKLAREERENLAGLLVDRLVDLNQQGGKTTAGVKLPVERGEGATQVL